MALVGFAGAIVVGVVAGNQPAVILMRATLVMIGCLVIGGVVGRVAQRAIDLHVERHKKDHPIPDLHDPSITSSAGRQAASQADIVKAA